MAKLKVEQFVDLVKRSGLVDDERLTEALSGVDQSVKDSGIVASSLTKAGLLTEWQSEKLLQGRHKGFYLGKYKLLNHIGTGGMGSVYLAEHQVMRHRVAIKLLPNHLAAQTSYLERFHQEARAAAALVHPNIIRAFDVDQHEAFHYLVMEFVDGSDLQAVVSRSGPLDYETAAEYTRQAARGLAYAHRNGLIHRDIKPANLLVDKDGKIKILDMGLARFSDESQGSLTMAYDQKMIGTVDYLAPEQALDSHRVDARADIYSLGCTLYFMLTGDAPFPQGTIPQRLMQHQSAEPTDVHKTRPDAPQELIDICKKMMAKSLTDRYQNGDEVADALEQWMGYEEASVRGAAAQSYAPPAGPSLNENLDLAPLEDEVNGRAAKSAAKEARPDDSQANKPAAKLSDSQAGKQAAKSGLKQGPASGVKPGSASGAMPAHPAAKKPESGVSGAGTKPKSGVQAGAKPAAPPPKLPDDTLVDDLLSAPLAPADQQLSSTPLAPISKHTSHETGAASRLGMMAVVIVAGAGAVLVLLLVLMSLSKML